MNAADHQLLDWLTCRARPGDLLMTGGPSRISHLIQTITGSPYSHTAVVLADGHVVEAFDVPLTLADDDDGAYRNDLADVVTRDVLRRVALRRPVGLDIRRLGTAPHHRTLGDVLHLSGPIELIAATGRPAATGRWIRRPSRPGGLLAHLGDCREALVTAIRDLLRTTRDRLGEETPPEAADLIVPGDFTTARPFVTVGVVQHDRGRWQDAGIHA
jgi:hypothetical protein